MHGLALNLDGCRFGDHSPNNHQHLSRRRRRLEQQSTDEKNCKNNNDNDVNNNINLDVDELSRQQCSLDNHHLLSPPPPPPSPMGMTYRHEGLSIGRDFLRFHGSTVSHHLSADDLHVETCLGRGTCSSVWRARRRRRRSSSSCRQQQRRRQMGEIVEKECEQEEDDDDEYYALKLFSLRDPNQRTMLVRELKLLCTKRCNCLVQMEGAFLDLVNKDNGSGIRDAAANSREGASSSFASSSSSGNTVTLVLEYMDRGSLADLIVAAKVEKEGEASTMIPEYAIAAIAYQILWGLSYLHHEGVLHRDIKPANVLVSSSGRVKLADFGIVSKQKQLLRRSGDDDDDGDVNEEGTIMNRTVIGTTRYMSPERLRGGTYKRSSDVWSVGLVLLELVRGVSPFEDITSVVELVQTLEECRMNDFIPELTSDDLREILVGCFDHCPHKRIPASILLSSPWFQSHNIHGVEDASSLMMVYLDDMRNDAHSCQSIRVCVKDNR